MPRIPKSLKPAKPKPQDFKVGVGAHEALAAGLYPDEKNSGNFQPQGSKELWGGGGGDDKGSYLKGHVRGP